MLGVIQDDTTMEDDIAISDAIREVEAELQEEDMPCSTMAD